VSVFMCVCVCVCVCVCGVCVCVCGCVCACMFCVFACHRGQCFSRNMSFGGASVISREIHVDELRVCLNRAPLVTASGGLLAVEMVLCELE
jgi:hypothetical protein